MTTKVYGASDDLIEVEGDVTGEVDCYGTDEREKGVLLCFSDGTVLEVKYGKNDEALWEIKTKHIGPLFDRVEACTEETDEGHSDVAYFKDGIKYVYACKEDWERVR